MAKRTHFKFSKYLPISLKQVRNQNGMGLMSVMVAISLAAVVSLEIAGMISNMNKSVNSVKFRADSDQFIEEVRSLVSSDVACQNTFGGLVLDPANPALELPIAAIRDSSSSPGAPKFEVGGTYGDRTIFVNGMILSNYVNGGAPNTAQMSLIATLGTSKSASGPQTVRRNINVSIQTDPATNAVTNCIALSRGTASIGSNDSIWKKSISNSDNVYYSAPPSAGPNAGYVGIGITEPISILQVVGDKPAQTEIRFENNNPSPNASVQLTLKNSSGAGAMGQASATAPGWGAITADSTFITAYSDLVFAAIRNTGSIKFGIPNNPAVGSPPLEVMRVSPAGYLGIANQTPSSLLHVGSASTASGSAVARFQNADGSCTMTPASFGSGIACSSDERLKENIDQVNGQFALDQILKIQAVTYNFKTDPSAKEITGYIAQDLQKVAPDFVRENEDGFFQVYYDALIPWITEAIKSLSQKADASDKKSAAQAKELKDLKLQITDLKAQDEAKEKRIRNLEIQLEKLSSQNQFQ